MSYSDFTLETLRRGFGLTALDKLLFPRIGSLQPSEWLERALAYGRVGHSQVKKREVNLS